jgi:hypothetical protein
LQRKVRGSVLLQKGEKSDFLKTSCNLRKDVV